MLLLLICLLLGWVWLGRRWLGPWEEAIPLGLACLQVALLESSNLALHLGGWSAWPAVVPGLVLLMGAALAWGPRRCALPAFPADSRIYLLAFLCFWVAWAGQGLIHDDDYGAHGAFQGQFLKGEFPPRNPFLPDVAVNGHYGRDLLVVVWSRLTGLSLFTAQFIMTLLLQSLLPLVSYWALVRWSEDRKSSFWGACFFTLAVRVGGRAGFLDTYQNNNPVAQLYFLLTLYFFVRAWRFRRWLDALALGLVLGGYAVVYETQFGLACLASLSAFVLCLRWNPQASRTLLQGGVVLLLALALACTQGGPLTDLARRWFSGQKVHGNLGDAAESQQVELKLKSGAKLWQIRTQHDFQSQVEELAPNSWVYRFQRRGDPNSGYRPFWDWSVLGLHHFPLFLSPLVLFSAWRRRDVLSIWLISFGLTGFLVPAVVDFGPYYESEWFRWEYAAGLPLAGALGIWLGPRLEEAIRGSWLRRAAVLSFLLFCTSSAWSALGMLFQQSALRWSEGLSIYAGAHAFVTTQPQFFCSEDDWQALQRLKRLGKSGQRVLVNSSEELRANINFGSTLACFTGLYPVGNRKPLESDVGGQWPFRLRADTRAFWKTGDLRLLEMNPVDWLYWRPDPAFYASVKPERISGVDWKASGSRRFGRVLRPWTRWNLSPAPPLPMTARLQLPAGQRNAGVYPVQAHLQREDSQPVGSGRLLLKVGDNPEDWLLYPVHADGTDWSGQVALAVPHEDGAVALEFAWLDSGGAHPIEGSQRLHIDFTRRLAEMELLSVELDRPARAGQWLQLTSRWRVAGLDEEPDRSLRLSLAALQQTQPDQPLTALVAGTGPGLAAVVPNTTQQMSEFLPTSVPGEYCLSAYLKLPDASGSYRVDWFLVSQYACGVRRRGKLIEVAP